MARMFSSASYLLLYLTGEVFVDCLTHWKELTWGKALSLEVSQQKLRCAHGS